MSSSLVALLLIVLVSNGKSLQNLVPTWNSFPPPQPQRADAEDNLVRAIVSGGTDESDIIRLVEEMESIPSIPQPAIAPEIYGRWKLLYTTSPNTSSPIQRTATSSSSKFPIYQDILVDEREQQLAVNQVIQFSDSNLLTINALASTAAYPLPELTARRSTGKVLGLNVLGVSLVGKEAQPRQDRPDSRIDFVFDDGYFALGATTKIPYPVPFRLPILRDWVKGWIDVTYLSKKLRISRGNKGSLFVLVKEEH